MFHSLACQLIHLIAGKCHWVVHGGTANLVHNLKGSTCSTRVSSHCLPLWHTNQVSKSRIQDQNDIKMLQNGYIYDNVYVIDHNCIRFGHFPWRKARSEVFHSCLHAAIKCISCCQHEIVNVKPCNIGYFLRSNHSCLRFWGPTTARRFAVCWNDNFCAVVCKRPTCSKTQQSAKSEKYTLLPLHQLPKGFLLSFFINLRGAVLGSRKAHPRWLQSMTQNLHTAVLWVSIMLWRGSKKNCKAKTHPWLKASQKPRLRVCTFSSSCCFHLRKAGSLAVLGHWRNLSSYHVPWFAKGWYSGTKVQVVFEYVEYVMESNWSFAARTVGFIDFANNFSVCPTLFLHEPMPQRHCWCPISWIRVSVLKPCALALSVETPPAVGMLCKSQKNASSASTQFRKLIEVRKVPLGGVPNANPLCEILQLAVPTFGVASQS